MFTFHLHIGFKNISLYINGVYQSLFYEKVKLNNNFVCMIEYICM